jgi:hypothetical protein
MSRYIPRPTYRLYVIHLETDIPEERDTPRAFEYGFTSCYGTVCKWQDRLSQRGRTTWIEQC